MASFVIGHNVQGKELGPQERQSQEGQNKGADVKFVPIR
jgi:hypothetical protein